MAIARRFMTRTDVRRKSSRRFGMAGPTMLTLWRRSTGAHRMCGRSTAPCLRPTRTRSRRRIGQSRRAECESPFDATERLLGFSVVVPVRDGTCELDDLFVEPDRMHLGIGRMLVHDLTARAATAGASHVDVIANPNALGFYARLGFKLNGHASTRFGTATRMTLDLPAPRARFSAGQNIDGRQP
jgi:GNAT superfamily N-acetyltransferase